MMSGTGASGWEDLTAYRLDPDATADLLARQTECTFIWTNRAGYPRGVIVNYIARRGRIWTTATTKRPRIAAVRAEPRTGIAISSKGSGVTSRQSLSLQGLSTVHDAPAVVDWFLPEFSAAMRPGEPKRAAEFARLLDSEHRVVIEFVPTATTAYDGAKMWSAAPGARPS